MTDDVEIQKQVEIMSLLPDRYYIILKPLDEENFTLTAYDTTDKTYEDDSDYNPAMVIQEGIMETVREDLEDVYDEGACLLYTSPSPRDGLLSRMPSSA